MIIATYHRKRTVSCLKCPNLGVRNEDKSRAASHMVDSTAPGRGAGAGARARAGAGGRGEFGRSLAGGLAGTPQHDEHGSGGEDAGGAERRA